MQEFKGTPGPWEKKTRTSKRGSTRIMAIIPKYYGERRLETELGTGYINDDDCGIPTCCKTEEHANATLIAAAPDMLNVLQQIWDCYESKGQLLAFNVSLVKEVLEKALTLNQ